MPEGLKKCDDWTEEAKRLAVERFLKKSDNGEPCETIEEMCWRVAYHIASADLHYGKTEDAVIPLAKEFYGLMADRIFFPNAPTMYNAGTGNGLQFSACFVLPVEDSMEGIYDAIKWQAIIHKSGGGTGFSFSSLRHKNAIVSSTKGKASGPVSFLKVFDASTDKVVQGGTRRGANMAMVSVHHPDILEIIAAKGTLQDGNEAIYEFLKPHLYSRKIQEMLKMKLLEKQISHFNISIAVSDIFMQAVKNDAEYDLIDPRNGEVVERLKAKPVFDLIVEMAWSKGCPGLWFIDKTNRWRANPIPELMRLESTNPCGEQPLFPFDSCNLGSMSLIRFVKSENGKYQIDWNELEHVARLAVHFLDNVIELNPYPLPQITEFTRKIRRIGLGVMGWADMLAYLDIPYASETACKLAEEVMEYINNAGHKESERLAEERGAFPLWSESIYKNGNAIRNCTVTTIAPTGELSILAGCSGGIEPHYGLTKRHKYENRVLEIYSPAFHRFIAVAKERGFYSSSLEEEVKNRGCLGDISAVPENIKKVFATAHEIGSEYHVKMQSAFQKYVDNAVSKTINMVNRATKEDVSNAYWQAYESNCLGITVFRDGCKGGVLSLGLGGKEKSKKEIKTAIRPRPNILGTTEKVETPYGEAFVTINWDADKGPKEPFEIFIAVGKAGTDITADAESIGRSLSEILRMASLLSQLEKLARIKNHQRGIGGSSSTGFGKNRVASVGDGIARAIEKYFEKFELEEPSDKTITTLDPAPAENGTLLAGNFCPQCHQATLYQQGGCTQCSNCNYTKC